MYSDWIRPLAIVQSTYDNGRLAHLAFVVVAEDAEETGAVCRTIAGELGIERVEVEPEVSKLSVVGVGMRSHSGIAAKMFDALASQGINIENISTSEIVLSCIVRSGDGLAALKALHAAFELDKPSTNHEVR